MTVRLAALVLSVAAAALTALSPALAADAPADRRAAYQAIAALPDLEIGVWDFDWRGRAAQPQPSLKPDAQARLEAWRRDKRENANANCLPPGMPQIMTWPYPIEFIYSPGRVTIAIESESQVRRIYTDGRPLPEDPDPAFNGHSVGRWEGDTLVVETIGLNPRTQLAPGIGHSDQARIVERIRKTGPDALEITTTIQDPEVLAEPWTTVGQYVRKRDWTIQEYICAENNRDYVDENGQAGIRLDE